MASLNQERISFEQKLKLLLEGLMTDTDGTSFPPPPPPMDGTADQVRMRLINYIKSKLDELLPQEEGLSFRLSQTPNISNWLDLIINYHLEETVQDIILTAPLHSMTPTLLGVTEGEADPLLPYTGYVPLPATFLRLSSFKMKEWQRMVTQPITPQSPKYKKQSHRGLRGGLVKPVAVLTWKHLVGGNTRVVEYFSVKASHEVDYLYFLHAMMAEDFVTRNPSLFEAVAWMCAGKVMQITGQQQAFEMAMQQLQLSYNKL